MTLDFRLIGCPKLMGASCTFALVLDVHDRTTHLNRTPIFQVVVGLVWLRERTPRRHVCSKITHPFKIQQ